jgi:hypothetical protein
MDYYLAVLCVGSASYLTKSSKFRTHLHSNRYVTKFQGVRHSYWKFLILYRFLEYPRNLLHLRKEDPWIFHHVPLTRCIWLRCIFVLLFFWLSWLPLKLHHTNLEVSPYYLPAWLFKVVISEITTLLSTNTPDHSGLSSYLDYELPELGVKLWWDFWVCLVHS